MSARTIYTQGDPDGAWFLYALANAYRALTGSEAKLERFGATVQALDHATDFFHTGTTDHYEDNPALLLRPATHLIRARFAANADHWVCAVASEGSPARLNVACSIRYSDATRERGEVYAEREHASLGRRSNDEIGSEHSAKIVAGSVLHIARGGPVHTGVEEIPAVSGPEGRA